MKQNGEDERERAVWRVFESKEKLTYNTKKEKKNALARSLWKNIPFPFALHPIQPIPAQSSAPTRGKKGSVRREP